MVCLRRFDVSEVQIPGCIRGFINLRAKSQEAGDPALEHPANSLGSVDVAYQMEDALLMRRGHDTRLDNINWACCGRRSQASQERSRKVRCQGIAHGGVVQQQALEGIVRGQLPGRHDRRATAIGQPAAEPAHGALLPGHADHAVDGVLVVTALGVGQRGVVLHAHVDDIGEVAGDAAHEARGHGHADERRERRLLAAVGADVTLLDLLVDAEAGGRVGELAEQRGRDAGVEAEGAIVLEDVGKGAAHGFRGIGFARLEADLGGLRSQKRETLNCLLRMFNSDCAIAMGALGVENTGAILVAIVSNTAYLDYITWVSIELKGRDIDMGDFKMAKESQHTQVQWMCDASRHTTCASSKPKGIPHDRRPLLRLLLLLAGVKLGRRGGGLCC